MRLLLSPPWFWWPPSYLRLPANANKHYNPVNKCFYSMSTLYLVKIKASTTRENRHRHRHRYLHMPKNLFWTNFVRETGSFSIFWHKPYWRRILRGHKKLCVGVDYNFIQLFTYCESSKLWTYKWLKNLTRVLKKISNVLQDIADRKILPYRFQSTQTNEYSANKKDSKTSWAKRYRCSQFSKDSRHKMKAFLLAKSLLSIIIGRHTHKLDLTPTHTLH